MAYHGYLPVVKQRLHELKHAPSLLEVGVDRGVTFMTLVTFLARTKPEFLAIGVDVLVQEQVQIMLHNLDVSPGQHAYLIEDNSLKVLPDMVAQGMKFDVVLLDGDHNYHTVQQELAYLEGLVKPDGFVIVDDYAGRWAEKDLWYADRAGYEEVQAATPRIETEKHGVKTAVDEWLVANPSWGSSVPISGEPIVLVRKA